jgi:hypothetical protein
VSNLVELATKPWHLAARFFTSLPPTPPSIADEAWADEHLLAGERALWVQMSNRDRRHSVRVAQRFDDVRRGASCAETAGALLHDVGKIECGLGTFARVAATLVGPRTERFKLYHDHEEIGARLARDAGSAPETVELVAGRGPAYRDLCTCDF